ncbi:MAG: hypothetical protein RIT52_1397, partial [Pseudomonadota bacterium]
MRYHFLTLIALSAAVAGCSRYPGGAVTVSVIGGEARVANP